MVGEGGERMGGASVGVNERCLLRTPTPAHTAIRRRYRGVYAGVVTHGLKNPWVTRHANQFTATPPYGIPVLNKFQTTAGREKSGYKKRDCPWFKSVID